MATPIAAGSVVTPRASLTAFELAYRRPLLGVCAHATAPGAPGDPPTNVVVAWEDGTFATYNDASGLIQQTAPSAPSLLGTVMQAASGLGVFINSGTRTRGPVVAHAAYFEPNGDPLGGDPSQNEVATVKTPLGYMSFPVGALVSPPGA